MYIVKIKMESKFLVLGCLMEIISQLDVWEFDAGEWGVEDSWAKNGGGKVQSTTLRQGPQDF